MTRIAAKRVPRAPRVTVYGRTYLDAEVEVPLATLAEGKGKVDARVAAVFGGFACNAARALAPRFRPGEVRAVTVLSWLDWLRLRHALPEGIGLDPILAGGPEAPLAPVSVIINPARECRILRDRADHDAALWRLDAVEGGALASHLHVAGRLPTPFVAAVLRRCRKGGGRFAWCGGDSLSRALERECDLVLVNTAEAGRMLGETGTTRELAEALAARATRPGAVRVVTGRGQAPTIAAQRVGRAIRCHSSRPAAIPAARITRLLGVGDAFAATFLAAACFDGRGRPRPVLAVAPALAVAQRAAARFITSHRAR